MLLKLFKLITSILLISIVVILVETRNFTAFIQESKTLGSKQEPLTPVTLEETQSTAAHQNTAEQTSVEPAALPPITQPKNETKQVVSKTASASPYIAMTEVSSDTDESYKHSISPCKEIIKYKLGTFDTRFGISQEAFLDEVQNSATIWGNAAGKTLFMYDPTGELTINLIYDERQARTVDVGYLILDIENAKKSAEDLKKTYESEKKTYQETGDIFTADSKIFQEKYDTYTKKVEDYNSKGGAPRDEYTEMTKTLSELKAEATRLEEKRKDITAMMESINKKVARYNEFVIYINSLITKSNSLGAKKFTEGRFVPSTNTIDIYQYNDTAKLKRVITHELGHALGINHNDNVHSIMYAVNSATTTMLSDDDIEDLKTSCLKK